MIGKIVVLRDNMAGVFVGTLKALDLGAKTAELTDARKIHYWVGAAAVQGLATKGCGEASRITPLVGWQGLCAVVEVVACSEAGAKALLTAKDWTP